MKLFDKRLFILFMMFGLLLTVQVRVLSKGVKHVGVVNLQETVKAVEKERAEVEQLKQSIAQFNEQIELYNRQVDDTDVVVQLEKRRQDLEKFVNITDVEGPGVIVIIDDADRELIQGESGNNVLVHDQDINIIVDELRQAGAEAISINDTRIVYLSTEIICVGPTVKINGEQMSAPYVIKAIGNRKYLEAAITAPSSYADFLSDYGLFVDVNTSISVRIDKYNGDLRSGYMRYYEEGGQ
ncbi:DUF881 domain-containing protein [Acidaminobacter sp. JC074]|uniref:DUF881 domain-containing protein n=1 Tax=Acidaminobacter sp. JC074 TaxID=2530199 RepID=UPI001F0D785D|nr:DUF881 domain-containing protein [Acidaminobacter sp. JC074]MCH4890224.1 DUF881 domain-containing protein [Acidaminobacter sp. JC074]